MTILVLLYLLVIPVFGYKYNARCSNEANNLTFVPAEDGIDGRYKVEWCTNLEHYNHSWVINLNYIEGIPPEKCKQFLTKIPHAERHSYTEYKVTKKCMNTICLTTYEDLIFNGTCFQIQTKLKSMTPGHDQINSPKDTMFFTENKFPKEMFTNSTTVMSHVPLEGMDQLLLLTGQVPVTDYELELCPHEEHSRSCIHVTNCTVDELTSYKIICSLKNLGGCYKVFFTNISPWADAEIFEKQSRYNYNVCLSGAMSGPLSEVDSGSDATTALLWGGAAIVLGLSALALAALFTVRTTRGKQLQRQVLEHWLKRSETVTPRKAVPVGTRVLLIYARDCPPFTRAVQILATALRRTGCQVIDIFSTEAAVQSARAPNEWLRRLATDPATRLLLLQSPAGLTFYCPQLTQQSSPTLSAPLLGRAAVRRTPHAADSMAMMALRLLGEVAVHPLAYRKCYVATIKGLNCEMVPGVTPLRRYELPAYADVLLRDLTPGADNDVSTDDGLNPTRGSDTADLLQELTEALNEMCEYVRDNPNYLTDELLYIS
ncbi:uncharacterized protein LOC121738497 [Aricia agestis]|uniref:uncharacterized protein LOC121738497 n=1 Tax=Aricia agestis TaxID=91739 RepID=UPI001C20B64E|nr:uncharacterized protein LOC121738497 [Aricia agestis]